MRDPVALEGQIVSEKQAYQDGKTEVELWLEKINAAKAEEREWRESAKIAAEVYEAGKNAKSNFNIYHANIETMIPALYNSTPIPDVRRRYDSPAIDQMQFAGMPPEKAQQAMQQAQMQQSQKDKLYSDVAEATERALTFSVDQYPFDDIIEDMVRDTAVTGRGTVRLRYVPKQVGDRVEQELPTELVPWDRFIRGPGLAWDVVPFIAFEHDLTRDQVMSIADDKEAIARITFSAARDDGTDFGSEREREQKHKGILRTIKVYEVWNKTAREVLFISPEFKDAPITREPDPLGVKGFYCTPRPAQFVRRTTSLVPVCPYDVYKPLINEIDEISKRIAALVKMCVVKGGYDPKMAPDFELLKDAEDGTYVPISASDEMIKGGGGALDDAVMHWPIEQIVKVVQALYQEREAIKQTIYEVMGIADILRGQVDPREKAAQSQLKAESGSRRLQRSQKEIARVSRDLFRMKAEIMHTKFDPQMWGEMTGMQMSEPMLQLVRSGMRQYAIDIETDSTVRADQAKYQEELNAFLQGTAQFGQAIAGLAPVMPQLIGPMTKVYGGFARKFNLGKQGEDALDDLTEAGQQPPQQPDDGAEMQKAQMEADMQMKQADMQMKQQENADAAALKREEHQMKLQQMSAQEQRDERKHQLEMEKLQAELAAMQQKAAIDAHMKETELVHKERAAEVDMQSRERDAELKERSAEADMVRKHETHEQALELKKQNGAARDA